MATIWTYTIFSALFVSFLSLIGIVLVSLSNKRLGKIVVYLVSFSAGALIGDVFIHILPEATEKFGFDLAMSLSVLAGILVFFILEKFIHWHHCHSPDHGHHKAFVMTNLLGDGLHNFIDGLFIATSYLVDIRLGMATTVAVVLHEIPQEIGDFGVLLHGGIQKHKAILLNLLVALFAVAGAVLGLLLGELIENFLRFILPFTAGGFIYVANTDLFPELHKSSDKGFASILHFLLILAGIGTMMALLLLE